MFPRRYSFICTRQPTGNESLVEKWILHKLNLAAEEINQQLSERNFMNATGAAYNFWLYELCDVYIVRPSHSPMSRSVLIKGMLSAGSDEADDGRGRVGRDKTVCSRNPVHLLGPRAQALASLHAVCDGGAVATPAQATERPDADDHLGELT